MLESQTEADVFTRFPTQLNQRFRYYFAVGLLQDQRDFSCLCFGIKFACHFYAPALEKFFVEEQIFVWEGNSAFYANTYNKCERK